MANSIKLRTPFVDWEFFKKYLKLFKSNVTVDKNLFMKLLKIHYLKNWKIEKKVALGFHIIIF